MLKRALVALAILVVLAGVAIFVAYNSLDLIVKWAVERYGPEVAGVPVHVQEVQISPRSGRGSVRALEIGNPPGFAAARAARFGEIRLQIDPATITAPVIHVLELTVDEPLVTYERANGTTNLEAIQRAIQAYAKAANAGEGPGASGRKPREEKRRFIVDRITLHGAKVTMTNPALKGQGITFDLPDINLRDVGKRQNGVTASELAEVVANALVQRIAQKVLTNIDLLRKGGVEGAIDALKGLLR